ncbi:MAG: hypothetical protein ACC682_10710 [Gemmatimonadota bacterium]
MLARIRLRIDVATTVCVLAGLASTAGPLAAQQRDARIPDPGDLWLEISPVLYNWTDQFSKNSESVADGKREPLFAHFDGPIAERLFPGPLPLIEDLNRDADALGFDPITEGEFSMGRLDYQTINAQRRRLAAGLEIGVFKRIAIGVRVPFVNTDLEPAFVFDTLSATVMGALTTFPPGDPFFSDTRTSIGTLDLLIAGGSLMGQELADAVQLRADTDAFLTTLQLRAGGELLVPTGASAAGTQMNARFAGFVGAFEALGLSLPALTLLNSASAADLARFFNDDPVAGTVPGRSTSGLAFTEFEVSARVSLIDQITPRFASPNVAEDTASAVMNRPPVETAGPPAEGAGRRTRRPIRLRTTVGAMLRIPRAVNGAPPMFVPSSFLQLPVSDGQTDLEFQLYQDVAIGDWFLVRAVGRYGIQMADQLVMRIRTPDRPYSFAAMEAAVDRDLGDYTQITLRPSIRFNSAIWIGLEYDFWSLGATRFAPVPPIVEDPEAPTPELPDTSPLEVETSQTRHMVGVGITYDLSEARSRSDVLVDRSPVRSPWQFTISVRRAVAGSGGQTAAPLRYAATFRIPIGIF